MTALSLETGYATELSVPHAILDSFKNLAALGMETGYMFDALKGAQSSGPADSGPKKEEAKQEAKKEEAPVEEPEEDVDLGGGLFGDDDDF